MSSSKRQRVEKVPGARRAKLSPAPGTVVEPGVAEGPATPQDDEDAATAASGRVEGAASGANDERLRRDVPPHY